MQDKKHLIDVALKKYREGEITLEKASEMAEISVWNMAELVKKKKIPYQLDINVLKNY